MSSSRLTASRTRLEQTMQTLAQKRQKEFEQMSKWSDQTQYYKNWERKNTHYQSWTSPDYYSSSSTQYDAMQQRRAKKIHLENRREKLRQLYFDEDQNYELEISQSPRHTKPSSSSKLDDVPTAVLKDVNSGLKLAEEDRRRHEAEIKLYHQWRKDNPAIAEYERNQSKASLKLAWLDQQIEKRMEQEKSAEEIRQLIEERERKIQEDEELELIFLREQAEVESELVEQLELQMKHLKLKDREADLLKDDETQVLKKKQELEQLVKKRRDEIKRREKDEIVLFNIDQSRLKLRKKNLQVQENLKQEKDLIKEILASKVNDQIENEGKRRQSREAIWAFLNYVREQQQLEAKRQKHIAFIFDSEAKLMWSKQNRVWREEQEARDKLFDEVLSALKKQIDEKAQKNLMKQKEMLQEREEMLQKLEDADRDRRNTLEEMKQKNIERKMELDEQVNDKHLAERAEQFKADKEKQDELERIRKEEEKIKQEIMRMQRREYPSQTKHNRRIIW